MTASKYWQVYEVDLAQEPFRIVQEYRFNDDVLLNRFLDSYTGGYRLAVFEHADSECISGGFGC